MGPKAQNRPVFEKLRKECNIVFEDECRRVQWPSSHRSVFEAIEKLKGFTYDTYRVCPTGNNTMDTALWKVDTIRRARKLVEKAKDLVARNEATWRLACEPLVFSRLSSELACKTCRNRVWRSEIEASADDDRATSILRLRQEKREICRCPTATHLLDDEDERTGLDRLFIDRAEDWVTHPPELAKQLPQDQRPDRVYGLRQTRNIERLLLQKLPDGGLLEDLLPKQPHDATLGQPLLFPFLVVEAKAGNSPDDWHSIKLQTAFPIFTYLNTQQSLRFATAQKSRWTPGPLVWFFMSRGEDWRLSLAYQSEAKAPGPVSSSASCLTTNIVQVWTGCITNRDDALRLLLIVDYMSDWARDIYRTAVITELRILAAPDADVSTVFTDTEIFSSGARKTGGAVAGDKASVFYRDHGDAQAAFKTLDSDVGVVRHAAPIESRFRALVITEESVQRFTNSISEDIRASFIGQILDQFYSPDADPVAFTVEGLNRLEKTWTGHIREGSRGGVCTKTTRLYTAYVVMYYLSPSWEQIRELCLISIAERALDILVADFLPGARNCAPTLHWSGADYFQDGKLVLDTVDKLGNQADIRENLFACISRLCRRFGWANIRREQYYWCYQPCPATIWEVVAYADQVHTEDATSGLGSGLPFVLVSSRSGVQPTNPFLPTAVLDKHEPLQVSGSGAVLIHGNAHGCSEHNPRSLCVYLVPDSTEKLIAPSQDELGEIIRETFETCDVYHTTRSSETLGSWSPVRARDVWNLEKVYGIFFSCSRNSFVKWLQKMGKALPTRQGSSRGRCSNIFSREPFPWHDPHCDCGASNARMREEFLRKFYAAEATAWARMAQEFKKGEERMYRCSLCCGFRDHDQLLAVENDDDDVWELCYSCRLSLCSDTSWRTQAIWEGFRKVVSSSPADGPQMPHLAESNRISTPRVLSPQITFLDGSQNPRNPGSDHDLRSKSSADIEDILIHLDGNQISLLLPENFGYNTLELGTKHTDEAAIPKAIHFQEDIEMFSLQSKGGDSSKRKRSLDQNERGNI